MARSGPAGRPARAAALCLTRTCSPCFPLCVTCCPTARFSAVPWWLRATGTCSAWPWPQDRWLRVPGARWRVGGRPELGVAAGVDAGLAPARLLLVPGLGPNWAQVVISLLDGCDLVVLRPPDRPPPQARRKLEAAVRRRGAVLLVAGDWDGPQLRPPIAPQDWPRLGP